MNQMLGGMITMALTMRNDMQSNMDEWKERILVQWEESKKMPRKKKKKVRKSLLVDWSIASYDLFGDMYKF